MFLSRLFALALAAAAFSGTAQAAPAVGYQHLQMPDPAGPPVEIGVWYPADVQPSQRRLELFEQSVAEGAPVAGRKLPLVVISHGNGGGFAGHYDTALALARAGYVVASLTHTGDNYRDQSRATDIANRPRQLKLMTDYMLADWTGRAAIDPSRIGAFGFSSGGMTVLIDAGGEPDLAQLAPHCAAHPAYYDCALIKRAGGGADVHHPVWTHDPRLKAVVVAAPALGFAFGRTGLAKVHAPIQLWAAASDHILPPADYAQKVRDDLPTPPDYRVAANADHYDFLAPCSAELARQAAYICTSRPGFDRETFHQSFDAAVVAFFDAHMK